MEDAVGLADGGGRVYSQKPAAVQHVHPIRAVIPAISHHGPRRSPPPAGVFVPGARER
jgi:hypothetical protein